MDASALFFCGEMKVDLMFNPIVLICQGERLSLLLLLNLCASPTFSNNYF